MLFFISDDGSIVPLCASNLPSTSMMIAQECPCVPRMAFFMRYFAAGYKDFMAEGWCEIPLIAIDWN
jgi:hypothetical protein